MHIDELVGDRPVAHRQSVILNINNAVNGIPSFCLGAQKGVEPSQIFTPNIVQLFQTNPMIPQCWMVMNYSVASFKDKVTVIQPTLKIS